MAAVAATGLPWPWLPTAFTAALMWNAPWNNGIKDRFRAVVISCEVGTGKPKPALFLAACQEMGVNPEETLFIGDTEDRDIAGATAVGMKTLLVGKAPKTRPDFYLPNLCQLAEKLPAILGEKKKPVGHGLKPTAPVSRILFRSRMRPAATIYLGRQSPAASCDLTRGKSGPLSPLLFGLAPGGVYQAG